MDKQLLDKSLENFFLNSNIQIDFGNFFIAILVSLILAYIVKLTYIKVGRALNDKEYFSDTFIPLAIITTLVITVIKFSLALSLGLVGALSIVRFRAAIKEPEELVYLFFIISIGLSNGANQFLLSIIATFIIILFLLIRNFFQNKNNKENYTSDSNILSINILDNNKKNVDQVIGKLKKDFKYLKLKSANVENKTSNYIFWFELDGINLQTLLKKISKISDENINISIYSKSGAFE
ncbi:MAG: DUF4956 domain-containing protein [Pelagibacteraceae bacterium TMED232]|nr:MAG: DUF4956 domain-containing protein [Pelagibacteraceae bacterium TMED232]|tara:strand:+ start:6198 stop:6908 length:711 start_codon:yes stop_codon:yes gene_type:complete